MAGLADHDVIVDRDAEFGGGFLDFACHLDIRLRRGCVAGGVVVDQDQRRGAEFERPLDHLARVDGVMNKINNLMPIIFIHNPFTYLLRPSFC